MPVDLKNMPDVSARPASPKFSRWMMVLMILIGFCIVISRLVTGKNNVLLTVGAPAIMLGGLLFILFVIYLLRAISANARDREREQTILKEVRRGRRALQILAAECCTAHSSANKPFTAIGSNLVKNENVFYPQQSWRGEEDTRLSQIARTGGAKEEQHLQALFRALIRKLAQPLSFLPADKPVMVLLEHSSSISEEEAFALFGTHCGSQVFSNLFLPLPGAVRRRLITGSTIISAARLSFWWCRGNTHRSIPQCPLKL